MFGIKRVHIEVIEKDTGLRLQNGYSVLGLTYSPVKGPEGNIEYLVYLEKTDTPQKHQDIDAASVVEVSHQALDKEAGH